MYDLPNMAAVKTLLNQPLDAKLKALLADRLADTVHCGLQHFTHILVVEADDKEAAIVEAIGFSPVESRIDKARNSIDCDWLERHDGWWELLYTVGNEGFAFIVLVEDSSHSTLAKLCKNAAEKLR